MEIVISINKVPIRLTSERWIHIIENHDDLAGYRDDVLSAIEEPDYLIAGYNEAKIALKKMERKFLAVIYKEINFNDGFIITAFFTSKIDLSKETILWQKQK
jgi:hypothetical protein